MSSVAQQSAAHPALPHLLHSRARLRRTLRAIGAELRAVPTMPFLGKVVLRAGVVLPFKATKAPAQRHRAPADRVVFQIRQGGAWHEFESFNGTKPVSKCGRDGWPNAKTREGQADCGDCAAKGSK